jgi:release factor glutamine methyltransferase
MAISDVDRTCAVSPSPVPTESEVVLRLRAAGCVFAEDEAQLLIAAAHTSSQLEAMVAERVAGQPLEYILGWAEFCGLRIIVEPGVFVPRRRTEFLVQQAAALASSILVAQPSSRAVLVDLCCGAGAIGAALASMVDGIDLYAADVDPHAVACARRNIDPGRVFAGDLYAPLPAGIRHRVDVLVANAPYVPTDAIGMMPPEARLYEARVALDGGADGLDVQRRIAAGAPQWLKPGGHLLIETSEQQAPQLADVFSESGLLARVADSDAFDATVVIGMLPRTYAG